MTLKELRARKFGERARAKRAVRQNREHKRARRLQRDVAFILAAVPPIVLERWIKEVR